jgi:hypothetical protein
MDILYLQFILVRKIKINVGYIIPSEELCTVNTVDASELLVKMYVVCKTASGKGSPRRIVQLRQFSLKISSKLCKFCPISTGEYEFPRQEF